MGKYKFASKDVLPLDGVFETPHSNAFVHYRFANDNVLTLSVNDQDFVKKDLEILIDFLTSAKEHLD